MTQTFHSLDAMATEYRANAALLELRLMQLKHQLKHTQGLELRRRLKHRIGMLHVLINEARGTGYYLEHYYEERESAC
ncbi:MAG: hypothetical protein Q3Y08_00495 [Butyricicoccus sp.]|uniref:hypothetical protein n=1 Tax=Intestinibacillus sp. Marseille-P6563 TaxID=2364792 RepID=UPI000F048B1A|nr:hypothetical protein [Intestinibacillus sp. Marseille-P6563]MDR3765505.1 hypothetical protein [Butyricicoccus sp.]